MSIFKRKKSTATLPELEWYYDAERKERSGLAWALALVSVAAAVLLIIGLFFGGRWVYRHYSNDKKATPVVIQTDSNKTTTKTEPSEPAPSTPLTNPAQDTVTTPTVPPSSNNVAVNQKNLTNTGPAGTVQIFIVTVLIATYLYRKKLRKQVV